MTTTGKDADLEAYRDVGLYKGSPIEPHYEPDPGAPSMEQMRKAAMLGEFLRKNEDLISPFKFKKHVLIQRAVARANRDYGEAKAREAQQGKK